MLGATIPKCWLASKIWYPFGSVPIIWLASDACPTPVLILLPRGRIEGVEKLRQKIGVVLATLSQVAPCNFLFTFSVF
jgi:hypothetical protein